MPNLFRPSVGAIALALTLAVIDDAVAQPHLYPGSPSGYASDTSNPLDGVGDAAGPKGLAIEMFFNGVDADPGAVGDRRGVFEVDLSSLVGQELASALLEFEVYSSNTAHPVNIYLYGGDGLITAADYGRTANLVFSGVLDDPTPVFSLTPEVQAILDGGNPWVGVLIGMTVEDQTLAIYNTGYGATDPRFNIKVVPEPATLVLAGLISLFAVARRRRR